MKKALCLGIIILFLGASAAYSEGSKQFKGLIIYTSDTAIEMKKGRGDITLYWTGETKVTLQGKDVDRGAVQICQKARARYVVKDGRRELVALEILAESYCVTK
jgi:hypothetical protein